MSRRLKAAQAALTPKLQELRDADDWQRWANAGVQEQLCVKMEALQALEDPEVIAREIRDLQEQWRKAADVPRAQADALRRNRLAAGGRRRQAGRRHHLQGVARRVFGHCAGRNRVRAGPSKRRRPGVRAELGDSDSSSAE